MFSLIQNYTTAIFIPQPFYMDSCHTTLPYTFMFEFKFLLALSTATLIAGQWKKGSWLNA